MTSFLSDRCQMKVTQEVYKLETYTLIPTGLPPPEPGLSRSLVESLMTVVPRLYRALARPSSSSSRSPWRPEGGGDWEERGESGAGFIAIDVEVRVPNVVGHCLSRR